MISINVEDWSSEVAKTVKKNKRVNRWRYRSTRQFLHEDFEGDNEEIMKEIIEDLDFAEIPSFVTVFTGVNAEPLYFLKVAEKGISGKTLTDTWGRVILPGVRFFKGHFLKLVHSRNTSFKKFEILHMSVVITPDEI